MNGTFYFLTVTNLSTLAEIHRWAKIHLTQLQQFLKFRHRKGKVIVPSDTTLARVLEKLSLDDLQKAFALFLNAILPESPLVAAVDVSASQFQDLPVSEFDWEALGGRKLFAPAKRPVF